MELFTFDCLPPRLLGAYGMLGSERSPTPNIDRLAACGVVFDQVYATSADAPTAGTSHTAGLGNATDQPATPLSEPDLTPWFSESEWTALREFLIDDGFDIASDLPLKGFLADLDEGARSELFDDEILFACDAAVAFLLAEECARVHQVDHQFANVSMESTSQVIVVTASAGSSPAGVLSSPLMDTTRHVPLIVAGPGIEPGRVSSLLSLEAALDVLAQQTDTMIDDLRLIAADHLVFVSSADAAHTAGNRAVRDNAGLYLREYHNGDERERFFIKPDDRWNQLDVAAQQGQVLDGYRGRLAQ